MAALVLAFAPAAPSQQQTRQPRTANQVIPATPVAGQEGTIVRGGFAAGAAFHAPEGAVAQPLPLPGMFSRTGAITRLQPVSGAAATGSAPSPLNLPFRPLGGVPRGDVFTSFHVDINPGGGANDYNCADATYDAHDGTDYILRTFAVQDLGVPIYAPLDGVVAAAADGFFDKETAWGIRPSNFVVLDHGNGLTSTYLHMRNGSVQVQPGQSVRAGQELGLVGSSGNSNWPHLHFGLARNGVPIEPGAGLCDPGPVDWREPLGIERTLRVLDGATTWQQPDVTGGPPNPMPRDARIAFTDPRAHFWVALSNLPANSTWQVEFQRPNGSLEFASAVQSFGNADALRYSWWWWWWDVPALRTIAGDWQVGLRVNGAVVWQGLLVSMPDRNGPFNRAPRPHSAELILLEEADPAGPMAMVRLAPPIAGADPDFDVLLHHYVWRVNGKVVRDVQHGGRKDVLARGILQPGDSVQVDYRVLDEASATPVQIVAEGVLNPRRLFPMQLDAGVVSFGLEGLAPNSLQAIGLGFQLGPVAYPGCPGIRTGVSPAVLAGFLFAQGDGRAVWSAALPAGVGGVTLSLQVIGVADCGRTNGLIATIP